MRVGFVAPECVEETPHPHGRTGFEMELVAEPFPDDFGETVDVARTNQVRFPMGVVTDRITGSGGLKEHSLHPGIGTGVENIHRAADVDVGCFVRVLVAIRNEMDGRQMQNRIGTRLANHRGNTVAVPDVKGSDVDIQSVEVRLAAEGMIVDHHHRIASGYQLTDHLRTDESGPPRHHHLHACDFLPFRFSTRSEYSASNCPVTASTE